MRSLLFVLPLCLFASCIGDDIVEDYVSPTIRIQNPVSSLEEGTTYQFQHQFINNVGQEETVVPEWSSADEAILAIDQSGLATAIAEGNTNITVSFEDEFGEIATLTTSIEVGASTVVVEPTMRTGSVATTSSYPLKGDFVLTELPGGDLNLSFGDDYNADNRLPGLFVYLSNNPNTISGAYEIGAVETFNGAHEYTFAGAGLNEYAYVLYFCKPFNVKVGDGQIQ
ncbi:Ig-like domain-containing protein [Neolewinella persica]|uniref:Ig-like domain-containing protein n=1 Tax=Neolewinella persica TaxID=70998 RepID=UPI00037F418D|nr:Ig-like domain-containing protein [Neolewinella persica]